LEGSREGEHVPQGVGERTTGAVSRSALGGALDGRVLGAVALAEVQVRLLR